MRAAELLRLGLLMALTMTLHNMPEGFAVGSGLPCRSIDQPNCCMRENDFIGDMQVAFSSFTDFGPYMALAIAIHNIPEVSLTYQKVKPFPVYGSGVQQCLCIAGRDCCSAGVRGNWKEMEGVGSCFCLGPRHTLVLLP